MTDSTSLALPSQIRACISARSDSGLEESSADSHVFEPTEGAERVTLAVVPGNEDGDSLLALHKSAEHPEPALDFLGFSGGDTEASLDATGMGRPRAAAGLVGTRGYVDLISSTVSLVEGLVDEPRRVDLGSALSVALDYDEIGEPYVLLHQDGELRLFGGADHDGASCGRRCADKPPRPNSISWWGVGECPTGAPCSFAMARRRTPSCACRRAAMRPPQPRYPAARAAAMAGR